MATRRGLLVATAAGLIAAAPPPAAPPGVVLALADPDLDEAVLRAFATSRAQSTPSPVRCAPERFDAALVADMVDDDHTIWDVCATDYANGVILGRAGLLEELDFSVIVRRAEARAPWWGLPAFVSRLVLARDRTADGAPKNWAEFYDAGHFPGQRAMPADLLIGVLESALLADGVAPDALYPIDADRAFARLRALRPNMLFWRDGVQARALMAGAAAAGLLYSHTAQVLGVADPRIDWSWQQGILTRAFWVVPKGGPAGPAAAMRFIATTQDPARQAMLLQLSGCGPADPRARSGLAPELLAIDPGAADQASLGVTADEGFYAENAGWLLARWHALVQG